MEDYGSYDQVPTQKEILKPFKLIQYRFKRFEYKK